MGDGVGSSAQQVPSMLESQSDQEIEGGVSGNDGSARRGPLMMSCRVPGAVDFINGLD